MPSRRRKGQPEPQQKRERPDRPRLSPDARKRLQEGRLEGRITEMKEALKLNDAQLKLWAPVEQQLRARSAARQQARQDFVQRMEQRRQQGAAAERPSLTDRLDRASKRMTERAQRMQAFTDAFKPFYASLSEDQKAVAGIVLRERGGMGGPGSALGDGARRAAAPARLTGSRNGASSRRDGAGRLGPL